MEPKKVTAFEFIMALVVTLTILTLQMQLVTLFTIPGNLIGMVIIAAAIIATVIYIIYRRA